MIVELEDGGTLTQRGGEQHVSAPMLHIIQETCGGVPGDPRVYASLEAAERVWLALHDEGYVYDRDGYRAHRQSVRELSYLSTDTEGEVEARWFDASVED